MTAPDDFAIQAHRGRALPRGPARPAGHYRMVLPSRERVIAIVEDVRVALLPGLLRDPGPARRHALLPHRRHPRPRCGWCSTRRSGAPSPSPRSTTSTPAPTARSPPPRPPASSWRGCPAVRRLVASDVEAAFEGDPALQAPATRPSSPTRAIFAVTNQRIAHELHVLGVPLIPRIITEHAHTITGIDIHPGRAHRRALLHRPRHRRGHRRDQRHRRTACASTRASPWARRASPSTSTASPSRASTATPSSRTTWSSTPAPPSSAASSSARARQHRRQRLAHPRGAARQQGHAGGAGGARDSPRSTFPPHRRTECPSTRGTTWSSPATWRRPSRPSSRSPPAPR